MRTEYSLSIGGPGADGNVFGGQRLPPSQQPQQPSPPKYSGGNIPSRSFRVLQMMTGEDVNDFDDVDGHGTDF